MFAAQISPTQGWTLSFRSPTRRRPQPFGAYDGATVVYYQFRRRDIVVIIIVWGVMALVFLWYVCSGRGHVYLRYVRVCFEGKYLRVSDKSLRLGLAFSCMIDTFRVFFFIVDGAGIPIVFTGILCNVLLKKLGGGSLRCERASKWAINMSWRRIVGFWSLLLIFRFLPRRKMLRPGCDDLHGT